MGAQLTKLEASVSVKCLATPTAPAGRENAVAVSLSDTELVLFGGGDSASGEAVQYNDTWLLRLPHEGAASWECLSPAGEPPCARTGHAAACLHTPDGPVVVVIGGLSASDGFLNDVHVLSRRGESWAWSGPLAVSGPSPSPRDKLSAVALGGRLLVFGGFGPAPEETPGQPAGGGAAAAPTAEGEAVDADAEEEEEEDDGKASFEWCDSLHALSRDARGSWAWSLLAPSGTGPSARAAHGAAAVSAPSEAMLVFGGRAAGGRVADAWLLDGSSLAWRSVAGGAAAGPVARSFHAFTPLHPSAAVCAGGLDAEGKPQPGVCVLDARDPAAAVWYSPASLDGDELQPRSAAASAMLGSRLVLVGGSVGDDKHGGTVVVECKAVAAALAAATKA